MIFSNMPWRSISICSMLPAPRIETGAIDRPGMVISTSRSSSSPASSRAFIFSRDRWRRSAASAACGDSASGHGVAGAGGQEQVEQPLLDALLGLLDDPLALGVAHQRRSPPRPGRGSGSRRRGRK